VRALSSLCEREGCSEFSSLYRACETFCEKVPSSCYRKDNKTICIPRRTEDIAKMSSEIHYHMGVKLYV
jgi:hypothetical protein